MARARRGARGGDAGEHAGPQGEARQAGRGPRARRLAEQMSEAQLVALIERRADEKYQTRIAAETKAVAAELRVDE
jgi:hypothetical protein